MVTANFRQTAEILQFPLGGRAGLMSRERRFGEEATKAMPTIVDYGSWYHDEAIREEQDKPSKPHS